MATVKNFAKKTSEQASILGTTTIGTLIEITEDGIPMVEFAGLSDGPIAAQSALSDAEVESIQSLPQKVLLICDESHQQPPVINGIVRNTMKRPSPKHRLQECDVKVDGERITLDAKDEILLRCGKSSILLRQDGKIVIKGSNLVSRSSGANKIKGSSININ